MLYILPKTSTHISIISLVMLAPKNPAPNIWYIPNESNLSEWRNKQEVLFLLRYMKTEE